MAPPHRPVMDSLLPIDLATLIQTVGYLGIFLIVFADSGVLLGLVLAGDSLLFTVSLLASRGWSQYSTFLCDPAHQSRVEDMA